MRKLIAGLIAGLVLGATGTGIAASTGLWSGDGVGYHCDGYGKGMICDSSRYEIGFTRSFVFLQDRYNDNNVFSCYRNRGWGSCFGG